MIEWLKRFIKRHIVDNEPEPGPWDLYIFPGHKVGEARTRAEAITWSRYDPAIGEHRAINRATREHIINGHSVWRGQ